MYVYVNGQIVPAEQAAVSVLDHGFLYGIGLFETVRVYQERLFLWDQHFARLSAGLLALHIRNAWSSAELEAAILQTAKANGLADAYVRISITGGNEGVGLVTEGYARPSLFIFAKAFRRSRCPLVRSGCKYCRFPARQRKARFASSRTIT